MNKKVLFIIMFCFFLSINNIDAKEVCKTNSNVKVCTETKGQYYYENTYTYQDSTRKAYKKIVLLKQSKNKKITYTKTTKDYTQKGVFSKSHYLVNDSKNKLIKEITSKAHSNGKVAESVQRNYLNSRQVYILTKKFTNKSYQYYHYSINTKRNKLVYSKTFNNKGKAIKRKLDTYNNKNQLIKVTTTDLYTSGRKYKVIDKNYVSKKITSVVTSYHKNTKKNNLYSRNTLYYNNEGKYYKRITNYYHTKSYKYNGFKDTRYNIKNNRITGANITKYYVGTKRLYSKETQKYNTNGQKTEATRNNYNYYGSRTATNIKKYNTKNYLVLDETSYYSGSRKTKYNEKKYGATGKLTSNLTNYYNSSNKIYLKAGYTYQSSTYRYHRNEYASGIIRLEDITTYKNKTITKTNYVRKNYDSKGKLINNENYQYTNGDIVKQSKTVGSSSTNSGAVAKSYPVSKGVVTSPSWFYPASFGGGWHPGIDVATYSVKTYKYAQPIKVFNDATVIKRYNSCKTTNSSGCGEGFGNYVVVATQYQGKFYTILYAHQTKLDSKNKNHKKVLDQDKKSYKKNEVIGYVGSSGYSSGYHIHIQVQEHTYAKSITDIKNRFKLYKNNTLFNVSYSNLGNNSDIHTINPDILFNLKYGRSW